MEKIGPYTYEPAKFDEITSDTLRLAGFIPPLCASDSIIDIGTGSGALCLMLAGSNKDTPITGVEIQPPRVRAALHNVRSNGLSSQITILQRDYRTLATEFSEGAFTHVVSNPPYVKAGSGRVSPVQERQTARSEVFGGMSDLVMAASHLMGDAGSLFLIFPVSRQGELLEEFAKQDLSPVRLRFIHPKEGAPALRFLVEAVRDKFCDRSVVVEEPIILR